MAIATCACCSSVGCILIDQQVFEITATSQGDMKNTLTSLTVMIVREGRILNGFLAVGLARREDASKLRAVELNMVSKLTFTRSPTVDK